MGAEGSRGPGCESAEEEPWVRNGDGGFVIESVLALSLVSLY